jgi:fructose-specific phosphotransferase system IIA component
MAYFSANHPEITRMNLLDILSLESTIVDLKGESKEDIIAELVNSLAVGDAITDRDQVLQAVLDREKIMSTGIGDGIAIPHGKSAAVTELVAAMGTQRRGVDFDALDGEPAFVFFLLVSPANVSGPHIKALARISRLLKNDAFKKKLIEANSAEEIIATIEAAERDIPAAN